MTRTWQTSPAPASDGGDRDGGIRGKRRRGPRHAPQGITDPAIDFVARHLDPFTDSASRPSSRRSVIFNRRGTSAPLAGWTPQTIRNHFLMKGLSMIVSIGSNRRDRINALERPPIGRDHPVDGTSLCFQGLKARFHRRAHQLFSRPASASRPLPLSSSRRWRRRWSRFGLIASPRDGSPYVLTVGRCRPQRTGSTRRGVWDGA